MILHIDRPNGTCKFMDDHDVLLALDDLKRKRHIGGTGHAWKITLDRRVTSQSVLVVFSSRRPRVGRVRNLVTHYNSESTRDRGKCTQIPHHTCSRCVWFDVPVCRVQHLPDSVQIRLAIRSLRRAILRCLCGEGGQAGPKACCEENCGSGDRHDYEPVSHRELVLRLYRELM